MTNIFDWESQKSNLNDVAKVDEYKVDDRFYKIPKDKDGRSVAMVRFLPYVTAEGKVTPYIAYKQSGGKRIVGESVKYLINKLPSTIGLPCPITEVYNKLIKSGSLEKQAIAKELFKPRIVHIANIQVIKDPTNPDNEGKFKLYEFGMQVRQLFEKWNNPSESEMKIQDIPRRNAFDPLNGYDVVLKLIKDPAQPIPTWNNSEIAPKPKMAIDGVDTVEKYVEFCKENLVDLNEFLQPDWYPSYASLEEKLLSFYPDIYKLTMDENYNSPSKTMSAEWGNVTDSNKSAPVTASDNVQQHKNDDSLEWMD